MQAPPSRRRRVAFAVSALPAWIANKATGPACGVREGYPNRQFTILRNRAQEALAAIKKILKNIHGIEAELEEVIEYLRDNRRDPQDPDVPEPKPKPQAETMNA